MAARIVLSFMLLIQAIVAGTAQNVGINMPTPTAPLHVVRVAPTSGPKSNHVMAILESDDESFIQLSTAENAATGFLSGDRWTAIRSSMIFAGDSSILLKSGGDISRMIISNKGRVGINTLAPSAQLHVQDSSVLFSRDFPLPPFPSDPPVTGLGIRMMWYPDKASFRSGAVLGQQWDKENTGNYSVAIGFNGMAKGFSSAAFGAYGAALGESSATFGHGGIAKGEYSFTQNWTIAKSYASFVIGSHNDTSSISSTSWNLNDPLFIIGNGTSYNARNNAMTVLKNGKTGINTASPQSMLHVIRNTSSPGPYAVNAIATFESNSSSWLHFKHPNAAQAGILSGNEETTVRSGLLFDVDSSMLFRSGGNFTRMKLSKSGYLGINTTTPKSLLHIRQGGNSNGPSHWQALATLESNYSGFLQFSQATNAEAGILSGNSLTEIRSCLVFGVDSSMMLRTGGNINQMYIHKTGDTGIGTTSPKARLHVKDGSAGSAAYHAAAMAIFERDANSYIELMTPVGTTNGIISSDPIEQGRSGIYFLDDRSIQIKAGNNGQTRLSIDHFGRIGIGTTTPNTLLEVNGQFILGDNGSSLNKIAQHYIAKDLPSIAAGGGYLASFNIPATGLGGTVHVSPGDNLPDGIIISYARAESNVVYVKFNNVTISSINPPDMYFYITVIQ